MKKRHLTNTPLRWIFVFTLFAPLSAHLAFTQSTTFFEQGHEVSHYGAEYGFPYDEIQDIIQDSQGYLWMINNKYLVRYDGVSFKFFRPKDEQSQLTFSDYFRSLGKDPYGNIWIVTQSDCLWKFDRETEYFTRIPLRYYNLGHRSILRMVPKVSREGNLWLLSADGILRIDPVTNTIDTIFPYKRLELIEDILSVIPWEYRKLLIGSNDEQSKSFDIAQSSKYLAIGIGAFDSVDDVFIENAAILNGDDQECWQMHPAQSIAVNEEKRVCLQVLELEAGSYTILSEQLTLQSAPDLLKMDSVTKSGVFLLPLDNEIAAQFANRLANLKKDVTPYLTLQNIVAISKDGLPFLFSELHGLFAINTEQDSFYLEKKADRIQIEGDWSVETSLCIPKSEGNFWVTGYYRHKTSYERYFFLGVWDIRSGNFKLLNTDKNLRLNVSGLQQDRRGNLWISTWGDGLFLIKNASDLADDNKKLNLTSINILPPALKYREKFLQNLLIDDNNNLWVGTAMNYLYKIDLDPASLQRVDFSAIGLEKGNFYCDPVDDGQGHIWFSDLFRQEGVLYRYNKTTASVETFHNFPNRQLFPLYKDANGGVIFGGDHSLSRFYRGKFAPEILSFPDSLVLFRVIEPIEAPKPDFLLINVSDSPTGRYHIFDQISNRLVAIPNLHEVVYIFSRNENGCAYIGTNSNLLEVDLSTGAYEEILTGLYRVFCMHQDRQGRFWLGTIKGITIWNPITDELIHLEEKDGLTNTNIHEIEEDNQGFLWLFTYQGVFRANPQTLQIKSFPQLHGIGRLRCIASNEEVLKDDQGYFNAFSEDGFYRFHPDSLFADTTAPRLNLQYSRFANSNEEVVDQLNVYAHVVSTDDNYIFPHFQNNVTIEYVGIQLNDPEGVSYRYRLEGLSESWQEVGSERTARFQDLPPGDYSFVAEATSTYGIKSSPLEFSFTILPPWYWAWWSKLLYVLLAGGAIYYFYRFQLSKRLAEEESIRLKELDEVKNRLYTNITHEFRTPLTVIQGMAQQINGKYQKETRLIRKNSRNLLHLVNQMLDLSKLESGKLDLIMIQGDIIGFLRHEIDSFKTFATSGNVTLHFESNQPELLMDFDVQKLRQVMVNLLSNAIKFTNEEGEVMVSTRPVKDQLEITVTDNGVGIPADRLPYIFDRFYQVDDKATRAHEGTGIGLTVTKELVELMQGQITVASTVGEGTRFTILLPVRKQAPLIESVPELEVLDMVAPESAAAFATSTAFSDPNLATALIIEDNEDIIQYLTYCLQDDYQVLTALDGEEGIKTAITHTPDVIICDVMMPEKDGFEVTATLKEDERTSHIPIILLTAKVDQASKVTGLDRGADAYLTKPFDREELMIRLEKLVALRKTLQAKYASPDYFAPDKVTIDPKEDIFIQKLKHQIEAHLEETEFGIEQLANAMNLSRSQLYRKTKALTGQSIAVFVRTVRLHHGKKLLGETSLSVSEVAYRVGFSDPAYFTKTYAVLFGYPPGRERG
ncbi:MAG: ATP-binding protein [bacterium]|nr:ATP-binding protein [bacterium]